MPQLPAVLQRQIRRWLRRRSNPSEPDSDSGVESDEEEADPSWTPGDEIKLDSQPPTGPNNRSKISTIKGQVTDEDAIIVIDSGASVTLISRSRVDPQRPFTWITADVAGINNGSVRLCGWAEVLTIIEGVKFLIYGFVIDNANFDLLIGTSTLREMRARAQYHPERPYFQITLPDRTKLKVPMEVTKEPTEQAYHAVHLKRDLVFLSMLCSTPSNVRVSEPPNPFIGLHTQQAREGIHLPGPQPPTLEKPFPEPGNHLKSKEAPSAGAPSAEGAARSPTLPWTELKDFPLPGLSSPSATDGEELQIGGIRAEMNTHFEPLPMTGTSPKPSAPPPLPWWIPHWTKSDVKAYKQLLPDIQSRIVAAGWGKASSGSKPSQRPNPKAWLRLQKTHWDKGTLPKGRTAHDPKRTRYQHECNTVHSKQAPYVTRTDSILHHMSTTGFGLHRGSCLLLKKRDKHMWMCPENWRLGAAQLGTCKSREECDPLHDHYEQRRLLNVLKDLHIASIDFPDEMAKEADNLFPECPPWHSHSGAVMTALCPKCSSKHPKTWGCDRLDEFNELMRTVWSDALHRPRVPDDMDIEEAKWALKVEMRRLQTIEAAKQREEAEKEAVEATVNTAEVVPPAEEETVLIGESTFSAPEEVVDLDTSLSETSDDENDASGYESEDSGYQSEPELDCYKLLIDQAELPGFCERHNEPQQKWETGEGLAKDNLDLVQDLLKRECERAKAFKPPVPPKMRKSLKRRQMEGIVESVIDWKYAEQQESRLKQLDEQGCMRTIGTYELANLHDQAMHLLSDQQRDWWQEATKEARRSPPYPGFEQVPNPVAWVILESEGLLETPPDAVENDERAFVFPGGLHTRAEASGLQALVATIRQENTARRGERRAWNRALKLSSKYHGVNGCSYGLISSEDVLIPPESEMWMECTVVGPGAKSFEALSKPVFPLAVKNKPRTWKGKPTKAPTTSTPPTEGATPAPLAGAATPSADLSPLAEGAQTTDDTSNELRATTTQTATLQPEAIEVGTRARPCPTYTARTHVMPDRELTRRQLLTPHALLAHEHTRGDKTLILITNLSTRHRFIKAGQRMAALQIVYMLPPPSVDCNLTALERDKLKPKGLTEEEKTVAREKSFDITKFEIGPTRSEAEVKRLHELLQNNKDIWSWEPNQIGTMKGYEFEIETGDHAPIKQAPRPIKSPQLIAAVDKIIKDLEASDVIYPADGEWASPLVLVSKQDGTIRPCVDYRLVNAISKGNAFPLPTPESILDATESAQIVSCFDCYSGFNQMLVAEKDQEKTAFVTQQGLWAYKRVGFGLKCAPNAYQAAMNNFFGDMIGDMMQVYLDDCLIYADTFDELVERMQRFFTRVKESGITLKPSKSKIAFDDLKCIGFNIGKSGIMIPDDKVQAIQRFTELTTVKQVRQFLGLASYLRRHLINFANIAKPLCDLLKVNPTTVTWNNQAQQAFTRLKDMITSRPVMQGWNPRKKAWVACDASDEGIGCVLLQENEETGLKHPVSYCSRMFSKSEKNWSTIEKEMYAITYAITVKWSHYLTGHPEVEVMTDNRALCWGSRLKDPNSRVARWTIRLMSFNLKYQHIPSCQHVLPDVLSRLDPAPPPEDEDLSPLDLPDIMTAQILSPEWRKEQEEDPFCSERVRAFTRAKQEEPLTKEEKSWVQDFELDDGLLYRKKLKTVEKPAPVTTPAKAEAPSAGASPPAEGTFPADTTPAEEEPPPPPPVRETETRKTLLFVVPESLRRTVFDQYHHASLGGCHQGRDRTTSSVGERFWWQKWRDNIEDWCNSCQDCAVKKPATHPSRHLLRPIPVSQFLDRLTVDLMGAIQYQSKKGLRQAQYPYIMVVTEHLTKYVWIFPLPNAKAQTAADTIFKRIVCQVGAGFTLGSDRGPNFTAKLTQALMRKMGVKQSFSTPYSPTSQGLTERANATIIQMLSAYVKTNPYSYHTYLPLVAFTYNNTMNPTTGYTPNELVFGRKLKTPFEASLAHHQDGPEGEDLLKHVDKIQKIAAQANARAQARYTARHNAGIKQKLFWPGDLVRVRRHGNLPNKFADKWSSIYQVTEQKTPCTYILRPLEPNAGGHYPRIASHVKFLKPAWTEGGMKTLPVPEEDIVTKATDEPEKKLTEEELEGLGLHHEDADPYLPLNETEDFTPLMHDLDLPPPREGDGGNPGNQKFVPLAQEPPEPEQLGTTTNVEGKRRSARVAKRQGATPDAQAFAVWTEEQTTNWSVIPPSVRALLNLKRSSLDMEELPVLWSLLSKPSENLQDYQDRMHLLLWANQHQEGIELRERSISGAKLKLADGTNHQWELTATAGRPFRDLLPGDTLRVQIKTSSDIAPSESLRAKVVIVIDGSKLLVTLPPNTAGEYGNMATATVDFLPGRSSYPAEHRAIEKLTQSDWESWLNPTPETALPKSAVPPPQLKSPEHLNDEQQQLIRGALSNANGRAPIILHGPPGTGKSFTLAALIKELLQHDDGHRFLVTTPANAAADALALKLLDATPDATLMRVHAGSRNAAEVPERLQAVSNIRLSLDPETNQQALTIYKPMMEELQRHRIIVCTLATASLLDTEDRNDLKYDWLISDESAQATQPQLLLAATLLKQATTTRIAGQMVLCGDPYQLRPVLAGGLAQESGLATSLMEHLLRRNILYQPAADGKRNTAVVTQLTQQYRSVPELIRIPNQCFYNNSLVAVRPRQHDTAPLQWHAVDGKDRQEKSGTSHYNTEEINTIVSILRSRIGNGVPDSDFGIISPYACQNELIRKTLQAEGMTGVEVGSVDMWQGREKNVIIYSAVRNDPADKKYLREGGIGHAADPRRFCVAISRARDNLIIIGSPLTLATDSNWARVLRRCIELAALTGLDGSQVSEIDERIRKVWKF